MPSSSESHSEFVFRLPRRALRIAGMAFGIGLLLFVIVWWMGRDQGFYKVETDTPGQASGDLRPLPEPLPGGDGASDMPAPGQPSEERPQLVEAPVPAPLPAAIDESTPAATTTGANAAPTAATTAPLAPGDQPVPIAGQNPAPDYPSAALRRGESGTVMVRVEVDAAGMPVDVSLDKRSGSRDLDRAAMAAVKQWRFQPAQREGQAVASSLVIPIDFKPAN